MEEHIRFHGGDPFAATRSDDPDARQMPAEVAVRRRFHPDDED